LNPRPFGHSRSTGSMRTERSSAQDLIRLGIPG